MATDNSKAPSLREAATMALEVCTELRRCGDARMAALAIQADARIRAALALPEVELVKGVE